MRIQSNKTLMFRVEQVAQVYCVAGPHHIHNKQGLNCYLKLPLAANRRIQKLRFRGLTSSPPQPITGVSSLDLGRSLARTASFWPVDLPQALRSSGNQPASRRRYGSSAVFALPNFDPLPIFCTATLLSRARSVVPSLGVSSLDLGRPLGGPFFLATMITIKRRLYSAAARCSNSAGSEEKSVPATRVRSPLSRWKPRDGVNRASWR